MDTLGLVKELELLLESSRKVVGHLKPETMNLQSMQWEADQKHSKIVEMNRVLKQLDLEIESKKNEIVEMEKKANERLARLEDLKRKELDNFRSRTIELEGFITEAKKKKHLETVNA